MWQPVQINRRGNRIIIAVMVAANHTVAGFGNVFLPDDFNPEHNSIPDFHQKNRYIIDP